MSPSSQYPSSNKGPTKGLPAYLSSSDSKSLNLPTVLLISVLVHVLTVGMFAGGVFLLNFLGFKIPLLADLTPKNKDIEFVLVENPPAPPRDKKTKNRSDRMTRSGGTKIPKMAQAEPQRAAGAIARKPSPSAPSSRQPAKQSQNKPNPQPRQQQQPQRVAQARPQQRPTPQPRQQPQQQQPVEPKPQQPRTPEPPKQVAQAAPPAPKMPIPKTKAPDAPTLPPSPLAPTIKMPSAQAPKSIATGPIAHVPGSGTQGGSRSGSSGSLGPTAIPGGLSSGSLASATGGSSGGPSGGGPRGASGSSGGRSGAGGNSSSTQAGSPGGGGGRPGIDAMPEPDFGPYIAELQRRIKRNWNPPSDDRDKRIVAMFTIGRDGRLLNVRIQNSSGVRVADDAAMNAIRASAPFRQLPANFRGNDIDVQFIFDYNVYRGSRSGISYSQ